MKLIKCHIENYGKLSNFDYEFSDGLNVINHENGWGKTTFLSFIKAMLYGLKATTKRDVSENERKKYTPWQGGNFGGFLVFEAGKKKYRIERYFGKKESDDTFKLIDEVTGKQSKDFSTKLGEELFGLDENAFVRCTFIPEEEIKGGITDSLSQKLNDVTQGTNSKDSLEKAIALLDKRSAEIKNRQNSGVLADVESLVSETEEKITQTKAIVPVVDKLEDENFEDGKAIEKIEKELEEKRQQINSYSKVKEALSKHEANKKLVAEYQENADKLGKELEEYAYVLNKTEPNIEEAEKEINNFDRLEKLTERRKAFEMGTISARQAELENYFKKGIDQSELEEVTKYAKELEKAPQKTNKNLTSILTLIASVLLCFGVGLSFINVFASLPFYAISIALDVYIIYKCMKQRKEKGKNIALLEKRARVANFIQKYEPLDENFEKNLSNIALNLRELKSLQSMTESQKTQNEKIESEIASLNKEINSYISKFAFKKEMSTREKLALVLLACQKYDKVNGELRTITSKLEQAKVKPSEVDVSALSNQDIDLLQSEESELAKKLDMLKAEKTKRNTQIAKLNEEWSGLEALEEQLENLLEQKSKLEKEAKIIKQTKQFLLGASDNLSSRYLSPLKESLNKYLSLIDSKAVPLGLDTDLNVNITAFGQTREMGYLSRGTRSLVDLCIRFALVDALFTQEKPFVILDDPFTNLDPTKIDMAGRLLKKLSASSQMLYITCHDSRKI